MKTELKDHQDVAEPDQIASGAALTGQENEELKWMRRHSAKSQEQAERKDEPGENMREVVGLVVLYRKPANSGTLPVARQRAGKPAAEYLPEHDGDLIFSLYERQERIAGRLDKKIERLGQRVSLLEKRGRE